MRSKIMLARSISVTGRIMSTTLPRSSESRTAENRIFCLLARFRNFLYCSGDMANRCTSRVSRSILTRLTFPETVLWSFASAILSASAFLRAEPLRRTTSSPPESIMRTNWSAASPPPTFMFPRLLPLFFCSSDILLHGRHPLPDLPAERQLSPL